MLDRPKSRGTDRLWTLAKHSAALRDAGAVQQFRALEIPDFALVGCARAPLLTVSVWLTLSVYAFLSVIGGASVFRRGRDVVDPSPFGGQLTTDARARVRARLRA